MGVLSNAMNVLAVDNFVQTVISGLVIVAAVIISNIEQIRQNSIRLICLEIIDIMRIQRHI